ncbi:MAG: PilZ domain-containing protein [Gemmataceae bacterium]
MSNAGSPKEALRTLSRRAHVRYRCDRQPSRRVFLVESYRTFFAEVHDLSTSGVGLLQDRPLTLGALLFVDLLGLDVPVEHLARVVHATPGENGRYLIGCEFDHPLAQEELTTVLAR